MAKHAWKFACLLAVSLSWPGAALPQSPSPDALATAKELIVVSKVSDQINSAVPLIMQQLKPIIVQGRPQLERDFDALVPVMMKLMNARLDAFLDAGAVIYARHFTVDEMRQITAFYHQPVGEKLLQKMPIILQETMALGQQFGQVIAKDMQDRIIEELRKRGHNI
jgi:hypothetical protein